MDIQKILQATTQQVQSKQINSGVQYKSSKSKKISHSDANGDFWKQSQKSDSKQEGSSSSKSKNIGHPDANGRFLLMTLKQSQKSDSKEEDHSSSESKKISYSFVDGDCLLMTSNQSQRSDSQEEDGIYSLTPKGQIVLLKSAYWLADVNRRIAQKQFLDLHGNIQILCVVRSVCMEGNRSVLKLESGEVEVEIPKGGKENRAYKFDKVFPPMSSQEEIFNEIEPIVRSAMDGQNICVLAYGQEEARKTFSMAGSRDCPGIIARTLQLLFDNASMDSVVKYSFGLSILQIYKGSMQDLLGSRPTKAEVSQTKKVSWYCLSLVSSSAKLKTNSFSCMKGGTMAGSLKIKMAGPRIEVENLNEVIMKSDKHGVLLYRKAIHAGCSSHIATGNASHRSHCLVRVTITRIFDSGDGNSTIGQLWLVNLGTSERIFETQEYENSLQENKYINVSLVALGDVLSTLQKKQYSHVPYRNNKLTELLRDCLGSDSRALILVHISPEEEDIRETLSSLQFSLRVGKHYNEQVSPVADKDWQQKSVKVASPDREAEKVIALRRMKDYEFECQTLSNKLRDLQLLMKEDSENDQGADNKLKNAKRKENPPDTETLHKIKSTKHSSMTNSRSNSPRFMAPTVSSRCKQISSE